MGWLEAERWLRDLALSIAGRFGTLLLSKLLVRLELWDGLRLKGLYHLMKDFSVRIMADVLVATNRRFKRPRNRNPDESSFLYLVFHAAEC